MQMIEHNKTGLVPQYRRAVGRGGRQSEFSGVHSRV
jgi:hypothetical protein